MIGHDDPRMDQVFCCVVVMEGSCQSNGVFGLGKPTGAVSFIHPAVDLRREPFVVFCLDFGGPRLRVKLQPCFPLIAPSGEKVGWKGVVEAEGDKVGGAVLPPVGKTIVEGADLGEFVEEF